MERKVKTTEEIFLNFAISVIWPSLQISHKPLISIITKCIYMAKNGVNERNQILMNFLHEVFFFSFFFGKHRAFSKCLSSFSNIFPITKVIHAMANE